MGGAKVFECFSYAANATSKEWESSKTAGKCNALKDTAVVCNSPANRTAALTVDVTANAGCGPCAEPTKKAGTCAECTKTGCNSATTIAYALIPLLAVIFHAL